MDLPSIEQAPCCSIQSFQIAIPRIFAVAGALELHVFSDGKTCAEQRFETVAASRQWAE
jgi:hypothetical protein